MYGPEGARAMRSVVPTPEASGLSEPSAQLPQVAAVAYTAADLTRLLSEKKPCWRWAVFASVLVQRRAEVQGRLRDSALGFVGATTTRLHTGVDYHERFLELAEQCRNVSVPHEYSDLMRDLTAYAEIPLRAYRTFIDDFVERVGEMPELLRYANGTVEVDPVVLEMESDSQLLDRIFKRLRAIRGD